MAYKFTKQLLKNINAEYVYSDDAVADFIADCKTYIKAVEQGRALFSVVHVSQSGMSRVISVKSCEKSHGGKWVYRQYYSMFKALGESIDYNKGGVKSNGCGMDMVWALNYYTMKTFKDIGLLSKKRADVLAQRING